ncbi:hypothetical protein SISSUDRAFT_965263, partial [Sistotremastrum suecicum HHB10207 ss-3]
TDLRHALDDTLGETLQHKWRSKNHNIKPEIFWSRLRRGWAPGFEAKLQSGYRAEVYDETVPWQRMVFFYVFIPWLQKELDAFARRVNYSRKRADRKIARSRAPPEYIFRRPQKYGSGPELILRHLITAARAAYAPVGHSVFDLIEPEFRVVLDAIYTEVGCPVVNMNTCWEVF